MRAASTRRAQLGVEVAGAGNRGLHADVLRDRGERVDQVLEPLLADQAAGREDQRRVGRDAEAGPAPRAHVRVGPEAIRIDAVGHDLDSVGVGAERDRPRAGGRRCTRSRRRRGRRPSRAARRAGQQRLGDVDIRSVEADDERQRRRGGGGDDAPGHDPVSVHDRRAMRSRDRPRRAPAGRERQRRGDVRRRLAG